MDLAEDFFAYDKVKFDWGWVTLFVTGFIVYVVLRTLKKLKVLDVEER